MDSREGRKSPTVTNDGSSNDDCRVESKVAKHICAQVRQRVAQLREVSNKEKN